MKLKKALAVVLGALMALTMATFTNAASAPHGTITVTYQIGGSTDQYGKWLKTMITAYKAIAPGVTVKLAPITATENEYYTKLDLQMKTTSQCPDVVVEDSFLVNSDAAAGYLRPMDDYVNGWNEWGNFVKNIKQGMMGQDGKIYGVPFNTDTRGLWYNKPVFAKAGLPANWQPKNWNDILTACAAIQKNCPGVTPMGLNLGKAQGEATSMQTYEMLLYGTGERLLTSGANGKWIISSPGINASLNFVQTLVSKKYVDVPTAINAQSGAIYWQKQMPTGKVGIILDGNWCAGNFLPGGGTNWPTWKTDLGFTAMPTNNGQAPGTITLAGGWGWSIPKNSKNPDTAWSFIKFISTKANMMSLDLALGNIATRTDVANDPAFNAANPFNKIASAFMTNAQFRPLNTLYPTVSTAIQAMVESVTTGTSVKSAITTYGNSVKRIAGAANTTTK